MTTRSFKADATHRSFIMTAPLSSVFTRNVATIDPDGTAVSANTLRFDRSVRVPTVDTVEHVHSSTSAQVLASGLDLDGSTPLMVYLDRQRGDLYVFKTGTITKETAGNPGVFPTSSEYNKTTLTSRNPSSGAQSGGQTGAFYDLFTGTAPDTAFQVKDAVVFHGLIVLAGVVHKKVAGSDPPVYDSAGFGFATSQDKGATWSMLWDDTANAAQFNLTRGAPWILSANPIYQRGASNPLEVWITAGDYRAKTFSPAANGGRGYAFKGTRSSGTGTWTLGYPSSGVVKYFDVNDPVTHAHAAGITEWYDGETEGLQMVVSVGDVQNRARFIRYILADKDSDYTTATWELLDDYHGARSPDSSAPEAPPDQLSMKSMQPVANGFGPAEGQLLWGADEQIEWLSMMHLPIDDDSSMDAVDRQAYFEHHYGWATGYGSLQLTQEGCRHGALVFYLNQPQPEKATTTPIVAVVGDGATGTDAELNRLIYTPSLPSSGVSEWAQIAVVHSEYGFVTAALYGEYGESSKWGTAYFTEADTATGTTKGLKRLPVPTLKTLRPALVAPGGNNLVIKDDSAGTGFFADVSQNAAISEITRSTSSAAFVDPETSVTLPAPPGMGKRLLKIRTFSASPPPPSGNADKAFLWVSTTSSPTGGLAESPCEWASAEQVRRLRAWVIDGTFQYTEPNKTTQFTPKLSDNSSSVTPGPPVLNSVKNRWVPVTAIARRAVDQDQQGLGWILFPSYGGGDGPDENRYYLLMDQALDGNGSLGYPQLPTEKGSSFPSSAIHELMKITGLGLSGANHWLLRLTLMLPYGNWDQYADRYNGSASAKVWPIFSVFRSSGAEFIEFLANCQDKRFRVNVYDGTTESSYDFGDSGRQVWLPESPLHVVVGYNKDDQKLYIGASLGGDVVRVLDPAPSASWMASLTFNEVRFRGAPRTGYTDGEVCEMRVLGGSADDNASAPSLTSIKSAFTSLSYL